MSTSAAVELESSEQFDTINLLGTHTANSNHESKRDSS